MRIINRLQQFDAYTKPLDDYKIKTLSGGAVTIISTFVIILLVISELRSFFGITIEEELFVDSASIESSQNIRLSFDVTFVTIPCAVLSVDVMDVSGAHQSDIETNIFRTTLDENGKAVEAPSKIDVNSNQTTTPTSEKKVATLPECGSCYGAETEYRRCCNTCEDVRVAYAERRWAAPALETIVQCVDTSDEWQKGLSDMAKHKGCRLHGTVNVAKVAGNFHIAPGAAIKEAHGHVHDLHMASPQKFDSTHRIAHLGFGDDYSNKKYPLDGVLTRSNEGGIMHQYYIQVVPTMYVNINGTTTSAHQFSVTRHQKLIRPGIGDGLPGFFVQYDFSPLMVKYTETRKTFGQFVVSLCAIVGGVFTVAGLLDGLIYQSNKLLGQKMLIGKAS